MNEKKEKSKNVVNASEKTFLGLRRFNAVMGFLHLVQGILMIVLSNDTTYPIYTNFLKFDTALGALRPDPKLAFELLFGPAVAVFLLLSAVAHFALATFGYRWYVKNLKKGMNPARFYEYALSSSLMIVLIGMLVGVWDLGALIALFGVNATMNLFGIMMELHNQTTKKTNWTSFIYGCFRRHRALDRHCRLLSTCRCRVTAPSRPALSTPSCPPSLSFSTSLP